MAQEPFKTAFFDVMFVHDMFRPSPPAAPKRRAPRMPPMKVKMLLHFYACAEAYAPEKGRTSPAYTQFIKELLRDDLVERPTKDEREANPGWAYRTTAKGDALVNAICSTPMPVERTRWVIPS